MSESIKYDLIDLRNIKTSLDGAFGVCGDNLTRKFDLRQTGFSMHVKTEKMATVWNVDLIARCADPTLVSQLVDQLIEVMSDD